MSLLVVGFGWVLFRTADFSQATGFWRSMLGATAAHGGGTTPLLHLDGRFLLALAAGLAVAFSMLPALQARIEKRLAGARSGWLRQGWRLLALASLAAVLAVSILAVTSLPGNPFIYLRF